jgi:hypothetical protein
MGCRGPPPLPRPKLGYMAVEMNAKCCHAASAGLFSMLEPRSPSMAGGCKAQVGDHLLIFVPVYAMQAKEPLHAWIQVMLGSADEHYTLLAPYWQASLCMWLPHPPSFALFKFSWVASLCISHPPALPCAAQLSWAAHLYTGCQPCLTSL